MKDVVGNITVIAATEEERCKKLKEAFFTQLHGWLAAVTLTVRPSPGVARALAEALQDMAAITMVSTASPKGEDDDVTTARAERASAEAFAVLERFTKPGAAS
ncbi:MAG TPA: hypothetical protein VFD36_20545 [Kofleriaceae bacterium]|nr:hypothetical protein [Kofleriaceae bacterium]